MSNAADSPRKDDSNLNDFKHTTPIPIIAPPYHRRRSSTVSSDEAPTTPPDLQTSTSFPTNPVPASPSSPIFSYFMSSPPKTASFPYRRIPGFGAPAVFEDEEGQEIEASTKHQRRATTSWCASRVPAPKAAPAPPVIEAQQARGAGVLRRLSLGGSFGRPFQTNMNGPPSPPEPPTPPPTVVTSPVTPGFAANQTTPRKVRRAATLNVPTPNARRRAPSPMGERILKGHFDGFN
jgi:hypothetical protein